MFAPNVELPYILNFDTNNLNRLLAYGYYDTIKQLDKLDGYYYTFNKISERDVEKLLENYQKQWIKERKAKEYIR